MNFINFIIKALVFVAMLIVFLLIFAVRLFITNIKALTDIKIDYNKSRDIFAPFNK